MDPNLARWRAENSNVVSLGNQIYLHVPFCPFLCHFCPLYKVESPRERTNEHRYHFVEALVAEIEMYGRVPAVAGKRFNTVYFGGGTPTELTPSQIGRILEALRRNFEILPEAEITLEGVAGQMLAPDYLASCADLGFNRISFGVQTMDVDLRKRIGRGDRAEDYLTLIELARTLAPSVIVNVDLMAGLPDQTLYSFEADLQQLVEWNTDSADVFSYVMLPGTKLHENVSKRRRGPPGSGERLLAMRMLTNQILTKAGFRQITGEVFTRTDRDLFTHTSFGGGGSALNSVLALGPSSFGSLRGTVYRNVPDLHAYKEAVHNGYFPVDTATTMNVRMAHRRAVLLGLLRLEVPNMLVDSGRMRRQIEQWTARNLVEPNNGGYRLTEFGALWFNHMQMEMLSLCDLAKAARFFGPIGDQLRATRRSFGRPQSYERELLRLVRHGGRFGRLSYLGYLAYLYLRQRPYFERTAMGFTGPVEAG